MNKVPVIPTPTKDIEELPAKRAFLLGQNAEYVVLYYPATHSTVRIPAGTVIVTSIP
jgi:hypothetical protein